MRKKIVIVKEVVFEAAHNLNNYEGACANMHGHSYKMQVGIKGYEHHLKNGMLVDFKELKQIIQEEIVTRWDHAYLNSKMEEQPSAENMALYAFKAISKRLGTPLEVEFVRLWETATSYVEVSDD